MLANNSQCIVMDFGSMTPATIVMSTRSEAQHWQVRHRASPNRMKLADVII